MGDGNHFPHIFSSLLLTFPNPSLTLSILTARKMSIPSCPANMEIRAKDSWKQSWSTALGIHDQVAKVRSASNTRPWGDSLWRMDSATHDITSPAPPGVALVTNPGKRWSDGEAKGREMPKARSCDTLAVPKNGVWGSLSTLRVTAVPYYCPWHVPGLQVDKTETDRERQVLIGSVYRK